MRNESGNKERRRDDPREPDQPVLELVRLRREPVEMPASEPQPSKEEVESVFRSVTASY